MRCVSERTLSLSEFMGSFLTCKSLDLREPQGY
nr:MAG TPA: hypothetical protein [Caudoviricetes sp.]